MKDQTSSLLVIAIIGIAIIGLGAYLFTLDTPLPDSAYTTAVEPNGAYIYKTEQSTTEFAEYSYAEQEEFLNAVNSRVAELEESLHELQEANTGTAAEALDSLQKDIETLRMQLDQARQASEGDWQRLKSEIATTYRSAQTKLNNMSH